MGNYGNENPQKAALRLERLDRVACMFVFVFLFVFVFFSGFLVFRCGSWFELKVLQKLLATVVVVVSIGY